MRYLALLLSAILMLGACASKDARVYFDGKYYPTKAKKASDDLKAFTVSVRRTNQGLTGAREAGRHAGIAYCIKNFGYSEIDWIRSPDAEERVLRMSNGNLVLEGRCRVWE